MAQVLVASMRRFLIFLLAAIGGFFCAPPPASSWQVGDLIVIAAACRTEEAALSVADADVISEAEAQRAFAIFAAAGFCMNWGRPIGVVKIAQILRRYTDAQDRVTIVARCISPRAPDQNFFVLAIEPSKRT